MLHHLELRREYEHRQKMALRTVTRRLLLALVCIITIGWLFFT